MFPHNRYWPFPFFRRKQDVLKRRERTATMTSSWKRKRCCFLNIINLITSFLKKKKLERLQIEGRLGLVELVPRGETDARPWNKKVTMFSTYHSEVEHPFLKEKKLLRLQTNLDYLRPVFNFVYTLVKAEAKPILLRTYFFYNKSKCIHTLQMLLSISWLFEVRLIFSII